MKIKELIKRTDQWIQFPEKRSYAFENRPGGFARSWTIAFIVDFDYCTGLWWGSNNYYGEEWRCGFLWFSCICSWRLGKHIKKLKESSNR